MSLQNEIADLRARLQALARGVDDELLRRYVLKFPPADRLSLYRRTRILIGRVLRWLKLRPTRKLEPWLASMQHAPRSEAAEPIVIWAFDIDRDTLRRSCEGFQTQLADLYDRAPVLITDIADFAFYSRLGWLVEYVPRLSAPAAGYAARKQCYLAWRYQDAVVFPASAGLRADVQLQEFMRD
ncbi:MAG TPA: hypothetical protein PKK10_07575 [Woeseiaceae bacterium]|nr:hypothetical protein [Woeseiaceae bacterium]